jgi:predicted RNA-binding protein with PIN domain
MHYLIDGHNLIGQLSDVELTDPDDEAKLVLLLRQWAAGSRKREITVIFDHGLPGGRWRAMSRKQLKAIFAPHDQSADELLIRRINQAGDPRAFTLISSDQQVLKVAKSRRMPFITSEAFAKQLERIGKSQENLNEQRVVESKPEDLSEEEIAEWLSIFDDPEEIRKWKNNAEQPDDIAQKQKPAEKDETEKMQSAIKSTNGPNTLKGGERKLSNEEVDEWLQIFGE